MTARTLYDDLLTGADAEHAPITALFAALRDLRAARHAGLAWAEWSEGAFVEDPGAYEAPLRLAADSGTTDLAFPVTYAADGIAVVLGVEVDGTPYLALDTDAPLSVEIEGRTVHLRPGDELPLPDLLAPPAALSARRDDGAPVTLRPRRG